MWLGSIEHIPPERLGGVGSMEIIWIRTVDCLEQLGSNIWYLVIDRNPEEGRQGGKIRSFGSILESDRIIVETRFNRRMESLLREIDDLQKSHEIG